MLRSDVGVGRSAQDDVDIASEQSRSALLIQKLQNEVHTYKQRCSDLDLRNHSLEQQLSRWKAVAQNPVSHRQRVDATDNRLNTMDDDQQLKSRNALLSIQLEHSGKTIEALKLDVHRLQAECLRLRDEMDSREQKFAAESHQVGEYLHNEHERLVALWRAVSTLRRQLDETKRATECDLATARTEMNKFLQNMRTASLNFTANIRSVDAQAQLLVDRERAERAAVEAQLMQKSRDLRELQLSHEAHVDELRSHISELTADRDRLQINSIGSDNTGDDSSSLDLRTKLLAAREQLAGVRKQLDEADAERRNLLAKNDDLREQFEETLRENDRLRSQLVSAFDERDRSDTNRSSAVTEAQIVAATAQQRLERISNRLEDEERARGRIEAERDEARRVADQRAEELERCKRLVGKLEHKLAKLDNDVSTIRPQIDDFARERDKLTKEGQELRETVNRLRKREDELQSDGVRLRYENAEIREVLNKLQALNEVLGGEKLEFTRMVNQLESDKQKLTNENALLHEALARIKHDKLEVESEKSKFSQSLALSEASKASLASELAEARREIQDLNKKLLATLDENTSMSQRFTQFEAALFESRSIIGRLETRCELLDAERMNANQNRSKLEVQAVSLATRIDDAVASAKENERDLRVALANEKREHEDDIERLSDQLNALRLAAEAERARIERSHAVEIEELVKRSEAEKRELNEAISTVQRDRDAALMIAENDKQQQLSLLAQERSTLGERLRSVLDALHTAKVDADQQKRELSTKLEMQRETSAKLQFEMNRLKAEFDDVALKSDGHIRELNSKVTELTRHQENLQKEANELTVKVRLADELREQSRADLQQLNSRIREAEQQRDAARHEVSDVRRLLNDSQCELGTVTRCCDELRAQLKQCDFERVELTKILGDVRNQLAESYNHLESLQRERESMQNSLRLTEAECDRLANEVDRLTIAIGQLTDATSDSSALRMRVDELEASNDVLRNRIEELEQLDREHWRLTEASNDQVTKVSSERDRLSVALADANHEMSELRVTRAAAEARIDGLVAELKSLTEEKQKTELKLLGLHSSLRRLLTQPRGVNTSTLSFASAVSASDVEPEHVVSALRSLIGHLTNVEREREVAIQHKSTFEVRVEELESDRQQLNGLLRNVNAQFNDAENQKQLMEVRLTEAQSVVVAQEETILKSENERRILQDKVTQLEAAVRTREAEAAAIGEQMTKLKSRASTLEDERRKLRQALDELDRRHTQAELARRSLDGEMQRLSTALSERERECAALREHSEMLLRQHAEAEGRAQSLQLAADRLSNRLATQEADNENQRDKLVRANAALTENARAIGELKKALEGSETERKLLVDRLESTRSSLSEAKRENALLREQTVSLQSDLSRAQTALRDADSQLRQTTTKLNDAIEKERTNQQQISSLTSERQKIVNKVQEVEQQAARIEKDRSMLKQALERAERAREQAEEALSKTTTERSQIELIIRRMDDQNDSLNRQIGALQVQIERKDRAYSEKMADLSEKHRAELASQAERFREAADKQAKVSDSRERLSQQRLIDCESQIAKLEAQLSSELRLKQEFASTVAQKSDEMKDLRYQLDNRRQRADRARSGNSSALLRGSLQNLSKPFQARAQSPLRTVQRL